MAYIDLHADTLTMLKGRETLETNHRMVSLPALEQAQCLAQCFSAFVPTGVFPGPMRNFLSWRSYKKVAGRYHAALKAYPDRVIAIRSYDDLLRCQSENKVGMLFTIEDSGVLGSSLRRLEEVYRDGVRLITLTWNFSNAFAHPNSPKAEIMEKGLTPLGVQLVGEMNRLGMLIDVSHLSDGGFWDVCHHSRQPFVASHSNARTLQNHPRNLTDEMIRAVADRGGVVGLNFFGLFLSGEKSSRISDMVAHVRHLYRVGGEDLPALGSDFDGISGELEVATPLDLPRLRLELLAAGIPPTAVDKMWSKNALRVCREVLKP